MPKHRGCAASACCSRKSRFIRRIISRRKIRLHRIPPLGRGTAAWFPETVNSQPFASGVSSVGVDRRTAQGSLYEVACRLRAGAGRAVGKLGCQHRPGLSCLGRIDAGFRLVPAVELPDLFRWASTDG